MLLCLETAFGIFSIALFDGGELVDSFVSSEVNQQAELLIPAVEKILADNNVGYEALTHLAVGTGPGSFTGLRIGLAAAKGIGLATEIVMIGVSSLEASGFKSGGGKVYLDAGRGEAYFQEFDHGLNALSEPLLVAYQGEFSELPDALSVGRFALAKGLRATPLEPLYIRKSDAKLPQKR